MSVDPSAFCAGLSIALIEGIRRPGFKAQEKDDLGAKIQTDCCTWLGNRRDRTYDAVVFVPGHLTAAAPVALWSQYSSFFPIT